MGLDFIGIITAFLIATGGTVGYFKAGSVISLIAGLIFALLLGIGVFLNSVEPPKPLFELIILLILVAMMGFKWYRSSNFMPSGITTIVASIALIANFIIYFQDLRNQFP